MSVVKQEKTKLYGYIATLLFHAQSHPEREREREGETGKGSIYICM